MQETVFYFAYGSNMNLAQIAGRCPSARFASRAWVSKAELRFVGHSPTRGGGVATMYPSWDREVAGSLFEMSTADLERMDAFEGKLYRRVTVWVGTDDGEREAVTYLRSGEESPPSEEYFQTIVDGVGEAPEHKMHHRALDSAKLRAIRFSTPGFERGALRQVFVYGTLMSGQSNHGLLEESQGCFRKYAKEDVVVKLAPGFLMHDLGAFPALCVGVNHKEPAVEGELYVVDSATLARLDRLEGHPEFYHRVLVDYEIGRKDGSLIETGRAWVYLMHAHELEPHRRIRSNNWKNRMIGNALTR